MQLMECKLNVQGSAVIAKNGIKQKEDLDINGKRKSKMARNRKDKKI